MDQQLKAVTMPPEMYTGGSGDGREKKEYFGWGGSNFCGI
jgi:hypothetical protein